MGKGKFDLVGDYYDYLNTPYENQKQDYKKLANDIILKAEGKWDTVEKSPPFWGNMMSVVFAKK